MIPFDNVKLKNDNISFIILSVDNFRNSLLILYGKDGHDSGMLF